MISLFIEYKDKVEIYALMILPGVLFGTLSFIGMIPLALVGVADCFREDNNIVRSLKRLFSVENWRKTSKNIKKFQLSRKK